MDFQSLKLSRCYEGILNKHLLCGSWDGKLFSAYTKLLFKDRKQESGGDEVGRALRISGLPPQPLLIRSCRAGLQLVAREKFL